MKDNNLFYAINLINTRNTFANESLGESFSPSNLEDGEDNSDLEDGDTQHIYKDIHLPSHVKGISITFKEDVTSSAYEYAAILIIGDQVGHITNQSNARFVDHNEKQLLSFNDTTDTVFIDFKHEKQSKEFSLSSNSNRVFELHIIKIATKLLTIKHRLKKLNTTKLQSSIDGPKIKSKRLWANLGKRAKDELPPGSVLLFIHGTAKRLKGFYPLLHHQKSLDLIQHKFGENIIGFQHPSYYTSIETNVEKLTKFLSERNLLEGRHSFTIVTTSRGCLVARRFLEEHPTLLLDKLIMAAGSNQGSPLASGLKNMIQVISAMGGLNMFPKLITLILKGAYDQLIGIHEQEDGQGKYVYRLNDRMVNGGIHFPFEKFYAVAGNYVPCTVIDKLFYKENDTIHPNDVVIPMEGAAGGRFRPTDVLLPIPENQKVLFADGPKHGRHFEDERFVQAMLNFISI